MPSIRSIRSYRSFVVAAAVTALALVLAAGCGDSSGTPHGDTTQPSEDSGTPPKDGTTPPKDGPDAPDGGAGDTGAPGSACASAFAGCTTFVDMTSASVVDIAFGGAKGNVYDPKCIRVRVGQSVGFTGNFDMHPLLQACGPVPGILDKSFATYTYMRSFPKPGIYGYYCTNHGSADGNAMAGAIEVVK